MSGKPKKKCCVSTPRCTRCPLRMLAEGTLPDGFSVRHRRLVKVAKDHARGAAGKSAVPPPGSAKAARKAAGEAAGKSGGKSAAKAGKARKPAKKGSGRKK